MIKALILYFLNIKPTHGYDIQKFVEVNGMEDWTKIQSGSIYYALSKMEKEGLIYTLNEEKNGARVRKIYAIQESGRKELKKLLKQELIKPIMAIKSDKFIVSSLLNVLSKDEIKSEINKHIKVLIEKKLWWEKGRELKITEKSLKLEKINFDMSISSLDYQIRWHEALLEEVDDIIAYGEGVREIISKLDFSTFSDINYKATQTRNFGKIEEMKNEIIKNPNNLEEKLDELINLMKNK